MLGVSKRSLAPTIQHSPIEMHSEENILPAPISLQIPKLLLQGKLSKKEEFDEDGHAVKSDWELYQVVLERSNLRFEKQDGISSPRKQQIKDRPMPPPLNKSVSDITVLKEKPGKSKRQSGILQSAELTEEPATPEETEFRLSIALSKYKTKQPNSNLFRRLKSLDSTSLEAELQAAPAKLSYLHAKSTDNLFIPEEEAQNTILVSALNQAETIILNNLCRVTTVSASKKEHTIRVMLGTQRSFLLKANSANEVELWMQAMKVSISMVNIG